MIIVAITRIGQSIVAFKVSGHADTAPKGQDIVCAGVSTLAQSAVLGISQHLGRKVDLKVKSGLLEMQVLDSVDVLTDSILETMLLGLREIAKIYPNSVRIEEHRR